MNCQIKFSIIIPNYNWGSFLDGCINSILHQEYLNYEIIIIDGKSTDNSHKIINHHKNINADKIIWIQNEDAWISNAFNIWVSRSQWDYILYLGSDDYLYKWILENVSNYIRQINDYWIISPNDINIFCDSINYFSRKNLFEKRVFPTYTITRANLIKYSNLMWLQTVFFNKDRIKSNKLDESNKYSMDYEIYFRMLNDWQVFVSMPKISTIIYHWSNISSMFSYNSYVEANRIAIKNIKYSFEWRYIIKRFLIVHILIYINRIAWLLKK